MLQRFVYHLLARRYVYGVLCVLWAVISAVALVGLKVGDRVLFPGVIVDNTPEAWFAEGDPNLSRIRDFQDLFGTDEHFIVAFKSDRLLTAEGVAHVEKLTRQLEALPYVLSVNSLSEINELRGIDGVVLSEPYFDLEQQSSQDIQEAGHRVSVHQRHRNQVISADALTAAIVVRVLMQDPGVSYQRELLDRVHRLLDQAHSDTGIEHYAAGTTMLVGSEDKASTDDAAWSLNAAIVLMILMLYLLHRRWSLVVIPLLAVMTANLYAHALIPLSGVNFKIVFSLLGSTVLVIGIADAIHYIAAYNHFSNETDRKQRIAKAFSLICIPCAYTSLTTGLGFLSMTVSDLKPVAEFAVYASAAMGLTFVVNMVLITILLSTLRTTLITQQTQQLPETLAMGRRSLLSQMLDRIVLFNHRHPRKILMAFALLALLSFASIPKIEVNTHEIQYFKEDHPIRISNDFIERELSGTLGLEVLIKGREGDFKDPAALLTIDRLQKAIAQLDEVTATYSMVDYLKEINWVMHDEDRAFYRPPEERELVAQYLVLSDPSIQDFVDLNYANTHVSVRIKNLDTVKLAEVHERIQNIIDGMYHSSPSQAHLTVDIAGTVPVYVNMMTYLLRSQVLGLVIATATIFAMMWILLRSFRLALISMIPNLLPVTVGLSLMGLMGIYLDSVTVLFASLCVGLSVDDTIHFLARFKRYFSRGCSYDEAIDKSIREVGIPLSITTLVLFSGFGVLAVIATFGPSANLGFLIAVTMVVALLADLVLLPVLIRWCRPLGEEIRCRPLDVERCRSLDDETKSTEMRDKKSRHHELSLESSS